MAYAQIIVKLYRREQDRIYTYEIPQGMCLSVGMMVQVPFGGGNRLIEGFVLETTETTTYPSKKIKPIARVMGRELSLARWMQRRYYASLSACLALFVPMDPDRMVEKKRRVELLRPLTDQTGRLGEHQRRFLALLGEHPQWTLSQCMQEARLGSASLHSLEERGWIRCWEEPAAGG